MEERLRAFLGHLDSLEETDGKENGFRKEFNSIKKHLASISDEAEFRTEAGKVRENVKKNRYKDILPYDQTRVPLSLLLGEGYSDYINANFIRGIDGERYYIATQGPLDQTVVDFWRMVWEFRVKVIVMACREVELGKKKCERYWATEAEPSTFGPFTVTNVGEETLGYEVTIRTLSVTLLGEARCVSQLQYTAWPDHGIPQDFDCLLEMISLVHRHQQGVTAPICIHCSAGCGRTGVICVVDYVRSLLLRKSIAEGFGVSQMVTEMRRQRPAAVQTKDQYEFVYRIVAEMFCRDLSGEEHDYTNWSKEQDTPPVLDVKQHLSKPSIAPKPRSLPQKASRPETMSDGRTGESYAVVAWPKVGGAGPRSAGPYENTGPGGRPVGASGSEALYSTVIVREAPRRPPAHYDNLQPTASAPDSLHRQTSTPYTAIDFGEASIAPRRPHSAFASNEEDSEFWVPSLPERTSESYIVQDTDDSRGSSAIDVDGRNSSKLRNAFRLVEGLVAIQGKKDDAPAADDGYEDVSDLSGTVTTFSASNGLGYNTRVSKPKGPRDPPQDWALYER